MRSIQSPTLLLLSIEGEGKTMDKSLCSSHHSKAGHRCRVILDGLVERTDLVQRLSRRVFHLLPVVVRERGTGETTGSIVCHRLNVSFVQEARKILYYHPADVNIDTQIRTIGYCEGLVKFTE